MRLDRNHSFIIRGFIGCQMVLSAHGRTTTGGAKSPTVKGSETTFAGRSGSCSRYREILCRPLGTGQQESDGRHAGETRFGP